MAIAAALERMRTEHPAQEYNRPSEQCLLGIVSIVGQGSDPRKCLILPV
jgi:hypothetical protein